MGVAVAEGNEKSKRKPKSVQPSDGNRVDREWFERRMDELGLTRKQVAEAMGLDAYLIFDRMLGKKPRPARISEAIRFAEVLKVSTVAVLRALGYSPPMGTIPVTGQVRGTGQLSPLPPVHQERVEGPTDASPSLVAARVVSAGGALALFDGELLFFEPSDVVDPSAFGRLAVVSAMDFESQLVGVLDRASRPRHGSGKLRMFGGGDIVELEELRTATPVLWRRS